MNFAARTSRQIHSGRMVATLPYQIMEGLPVQSQSLR
jgi:hypothetical protein